MQAVSSAILDQIQKLDPPPRDASTSSRTPDGRQILRGAPISSSRNDPHPSDSSFPTPLPNIPLPYELTLLDNLFVNPMVRHNKASDYTCGSKNRQPTKQTDAGPLYTNPTQFNSFVGQAPQSLPPVAFQQQHPHPQPPSGSASFNIGVNPLPQTSAGLGAYGMAAVGNTGQIDPNNLFTMQTPGGNTMSLSGNNANGTNSSNGGAGNNNSNGSGSNNANNNGGGGEEGAQFDVFSFLMDDEAGLGNGWDSLEVPSDFSLWT